MPLASSPRLHRGAIAARGTPAETQDLRVTLAKEICAWLAIRQAKGETKVALARELRLNISRLHALAAMRVDQFSVDALAAIARRAGLVVRLSVTRTWKRKA